MLQSAFRSQPKLGEVLYIVATTQRHEAPTRYWLGLFCFRVLDVAIDVAFKSTSTELK